jgi:hypothetical protein
MQESSPPIGHRARPLDRIYGQRQINVHLLMGNDDGPAAIGCCASGSRASRSMKMPSIPRPSRPQRFEISRARGRRLTDYNRNAVPRYRNNPVAANRYDLAISSSYRGDQCASRVSGPATPSPRPSTVCTIRKMRSSIAFGGRSWNGFDKRSDLADAGPTAVVLNDWLSRSNRRKDCRPLVTSEKHYRLCDPVGGIRYAQGVQRM